MKTLKSHLIKLAYENPDLRSELLPLLSKSARETLTWEEFLELEVDNPDYDSRKPNMKKRVKIKSLDRKNPKHRKILKKEEEKFKDDREFGDLVPKEMNPLYWIHSTVTKGLEKLLGWDKDDEDDDPKEPNRIQQLEEDIAKFLTPVFKQKTASDKKDEFSKAIKALKKHLKPQYDNDDYSVISKKLDDMQTQFEKSFTKKGSHRRENMSLKQKLVRLAYENPQMRPQLLGLFRISKKKKILTPNKIDQRSKNVFGDKHPKYSDSIDVVDTQVRSELNSLIKKVKTYNEPRRALDRIEEIIEFQNTPGYELHKLGLKKGEKVSKNDSVADFLSKFDNRPVDGDIPKSYLNKSISEAITSMDGEIDPIHKEIKEKEKERDSLYESDLSKLPKGLKSLIDRDFEKKVSEALQKVDLSKVNRDLLGSFVKDFTPSLKKTFDNIKSKQEKKYNRKTLLQKTITNPETGNNVKVMSLEMIKDKTPGQEAALKKFWQKYNN